MQKYPKISSLQMQPKIDMAYKIYCSKIDSLSTFNISFHL